MAALIDSRAAVEDQRSAALSLLTSAFEDEDAEEDEYEMRNAKREVPGENARKRS
jgi:hypothetical protein